MTALMMYTLVIGVLIAGAARAAESIRRNAGKPMRFVWAGGIVLLLALILLAPSRAQLSPTSVAVAVKDVVVSSPVMDKPGTVQTVVGVLRAFSETLTSPFATLTSAASELSPAVGQALSVMWVLSSLAALALLACVFAHSRNLRRRWPRTALLGSEVRVAPDTGPAVMGIAPPEVVIPAWVLTRTRSEQQLVLLHEFEHLNARDPWLLLFGCVCVALIPWHPALWYMLRRLRLAMEMDCDSRVLRSGAQVPEYGELLVELSGYHSPMASFTPALALNTSHLEQRLLAMTSRPVRHHVLRMIAGACLVGTALLIACETTPPTANEAAVIETAKSVNGVALSADSNRLIVGDTIVFDRDSSAATTVTGPNGVPLTVTSKMIGIYKGQEYMSVKLLRDGVEERKIDTIQFRVREDRPESEKVIGKAMTNLVTLRDDSVTRIGNKLMLTPTSKQAFDGLVFIDGVQVPVTRLRELNNDRIESVEVLKGNAMAGKYSDPRAANGVISISLKKR